MHRPTASSYRRPFVPDVFTGILHLLQDEVPCSLVGSCPAEAGSTSITLRLTCRQFNPPRKRCPQAEGPRRCSPGVSRRSCRKPRAVGEGGLPEFQRVVRRRFYASRSGASCLLRSATTSCSRTVRSTSLSVRMYRHPLPILCFPSFESKLLLPQDACRQVDTDVALSRRETGQARSRLRDHSRTCSDSCRTRRCLSPTSSGLFRRLGHQLGQSFTVFAPGPRPRWRRGSSPTLASVAFVLFSAIATPIGHGDDAPNGLELCCPAEAGRLPLIVAHAGGPDTFAYAPARRSKILVLFQGRRSSRRPRAVGGGGLPGLQRVVGRR